LFIDGKLVGKTKESTKLPDGLYVLMGQLYPRSAYLNDEVTSRLFVGELDEVALYDRALSESEIQQHFQLAQPDLESIHHVDDNKI
jgi:hypothetical protein